MSGGADPFLFIITHAEARSESVNGFINRAITLRLWSGTTALLRLLRGKERGNITPISPLKIQQRFFSGGGLSKAGPSPTCISDSPQHS